jgi:hypothetical protein
MTERLLDCRPPRQDSDTTSASVHPELLVGELVMRPRIHVRLTPDDQNIVSKWSRRMGVAAMMVLVAVGVWPIVNPYFYSSVAANASERTNNPDCRTWDTRASEAIKTFVQGSKHDINLKHISDMITQMRRARRNCQLGWPLLACEDYRAIVRGLVGAAETISGMSFECGPTIAGDPDATLEVSKRH